MARKRLKKILIVTAIVIVALVVVIILVISPVTKYMIEKYDEKYTGRQIDIGWLYINPFTGYAHIRNLTVFENRSNKVFFSAKGFTVNVSVTKLLSKVYEVSRFSIDEPKARIIQNGNEFNYSDILRKFSNDEKMPVNADTVRFSIKNIRINNGEFHYIENHVPVNYFIKNVNFQSKGKKWDVDTIGGKFSFLSGPGSGSIRGSFSFNTKTLDYSTATVIENFDLKIVEQYMKEMANDGQLRGTLDANLNIAGDIDDSTKFYTKGRLAINDFHFGKDDNDDYFSFEKFVIKIQEMSLQKGVRILDTVLLVRPKMKYERYDKLDNIQIMFGENGSKIDSVKANEKFNLILELADYMKMLSRTFRKDYFKINSFAIEKADIRYNDYSLSEKFSMAFNPLTITADSIDKNRDEITIKAKSLIQPHGEVSAKINVNPKNTGYLDMSYQLRNLPASIFNPYLISFTSYPLDRGTIEFHGNWIVKDSIINSRNHFMVIDPRVSKKVRKKDTKWIPMPLIMSFIRERGNVIDYEIPIEGSLKDPKFKIGDILSDLLKNIFIKPPSTPYIFDVRSTENKLEKSLSIKWIMRTAKLLPNQEKFIEKISKFLKDNPEAAINVNPIQYDVKEKEHILLFEAKKKYYLTKINKSSSKLEEEDSIQVEKLSVKDPAFLKYLDAYVKDSSLYTVQEKCSVFLGNNFVQQKYIAMLQRRENEFLNYFKENKTDSQVKILRANNMIPFNGFSFYKISYKGDIPDELLEAYQKIDDYNDENPRKRYKQWRE